MTSPDQIPPPPENDLSQLARELVPQVFDGRCGDIVEKLRTGLGEWLINVETRVGSTATKPHTYLESPDGIVFDPLWVQHVSDIRRVGPETPRILCVTREHLHGYLKQAGVPEQALNAWRDPNDPDQPPPTPAPQPSPPPAPSPNKKQHPETVANDQPSRPPSTEDIYSARWGENSVGQVAQELSDVAREFPVTDLLSVRQEIVKVHEQLTIELERSPTGEISLATALTTNVIEDIKNVFSQIGVAVDEINKYITENLCTPREVGARGSLIHDTYQTEATVNARLQSLAEKIAQITEHLRQQLARTHSITRGTSDPDARITFIESCISEAGSVLGDSQFTILQIRTYVQEHVAKKTRARGGS